MFSEAAIKNTMSGTVACMRAAGIKITAASLVERNTRRASAARAAAALARCQRNSRAGNRSKANRITGRRRHPARRPREAGGGPWAGLRKRVPADIQTPERQGALTSSSRYGKFMIKIAARGGRGPVRLPPALRRRRGAIGVRGFRSRSRTPPSSKPMR